MNDKVNHPEHYTQGDVECIEAIEAALTPEEFIGYLRGSIMKYIWRCRDKNGHEDVEKCGFYRDLLAERDLDNPSHRPRGYVFPAFEDMSNAWIDQAFKIEEEIQEVHVALDDYNKGYGRFGLASPTPVMMETMDVIHACETLLRMMHVSDYDYDVLREKVVEKNRTRGYYGDESDS